MATWPLRARFDHCRKVGKKQAIGGPFYFPFDNGNAQQATPWIVYMKIAQPGAEAIVAAPVWTQHSFAPNVGIANDPQESMFSHVILT